MATLPTEANRNLQATVREGIIRSLKTQVLQRMPLFARILDSGRKSLKMGMSYLRFPVLMATATDMVEDYGPNDPFTTERKTLLDTAYVKLKRFRTSVSYGLEEYEQNISGSDPDAAILGLKRVLVDQSMYGMREHLYKALYGAGTDSGTGFQGLRSALTHDATYLGLERGTTVTNPWWQGASVGATIGTPDYTDQATARTASVAAVRNMYDASMRYAVTAKPGDYLLPLGPLLFRALQSEIEARGFKTSSPAQATPLVKYGFQTLDIDGIEVVRDDYLRESNISGSSSWAFLIHVPSWHVWFHRERNFKMTPFVWQAAMDGGRDEYVSRLLVAGNIFCTQPNANCFQSGWTTT